ncbi:hypothetical protein ACN28S_64845 [Cystobacter fuscus]
MEAEIQSSLTILRRTRYQEMLDTVTLYQQVVNCLQGRTAQPWSLDSAEVEAASLFNRFRLHQSTHPLGTWYMCRMMVLYFAGQYTEALEMGREAERLLPSALPLLLVPGSYFYLALSVAAAPPKVGARESREDTLQRILKDFRIWAENCPENFLHQQHLIAAELARIENRDQEAMHLYDEAIEGARGAEYLQVEALGNELAARFHLQRGRQRVAQGYLLDARDAYTRWEATAKVNQLEEQFLTCWGAAPRAGLKPLAPNSGSPRSLPRSQSAACWT